MRHIKCKHFQSKYNIEISRTENEIMVYNSLTMALVRIPCDIWKMECYEGERDEEWSTLIESGIWVDCDVDETQMLHSLLIEQQKTGDEIVSITIAPTYSCNMKCSYCFQTDDNEKLMDEKTSHMIISVCKQIISRHKGVSITWFGGEPLLGISTIKLIAENLISFCDERGLSYESAIITNGTLISKETVDELVRLRVSQIQVTLDGIDHDLTRRMKNGQSSYDMIVSNLYLVVGRMGVVLRSNVSVENSKSIHDMIDQLMNIDLFRNNLYFSFYPITDFEGKGSKGDGSCRYMELPQYSGVLDSLLRHVLQYQDISHVSNVNLYSSTVPCEAIFRDTVCFDSYGDVYKCSLSMQNHEMVIGNILHDSIDDILNREDQSGWLSFEWDETCKDCSFLPMCHSGCIFQRRVTGHRYCTLDKHTCRALMQLFYEKSGAND